MSDIQSGLSLRYDSRLRRVTLLLGHAGCGLLFAGGCILSILLASPDDASESTAGVSHFHLLPEAGFLLGLAAGSATVRYLYRLFALSTLFSVALAAGLSAGLLLTASLHHFDTLWPFIIGRVTMGFAASVCWMSNLELAKLSIPNHSRWRVTGQMQFAFMAFGLLLAITSRAETVRLGLVPAPDPQQSRMVAEDQLFFDWNRAWIYTGNIQKLLWTVMLAAPLSAIVFRGIRQIVPTEVTGPSPAATSIPPACSAHHDHDHDPSLLNGTVRGETGATADVCDAADCCGGSRPAPNVPQWAGIMLAASAFLLFFGPLLDAVSTAIIDATIFSVWIPGAALLAGVGLFRLGANQTGNTITLPLFLVLSVTLFPVQHWVSSVPLTTAMLFLSLAASTGTIEGLLAIVRESFRDNTGGSSRASAASLENVYAIGALTAAIVLTVLGLIRMNSSHPAGQLWLLYAVVPLISGIASVYALRSIPQPVVVTRFAPRYLKSAVQKH